VYEDKISLICHTSRFLLRLDHHQVLSIVESIYILDNPAASDIIFHLNIRGRKFGEDTLRNFFIVLLSIFILIGCGSKTKTTNIKEQPAENTQEMIGETQSQDSGTIPDPEEFIAVDVHPEMITEAIPEYPKRAFNEKIAADVIVQIFVDENGNVKKSQVRNCTAPGWKFEETAVKASYYTKWKPALRAGKPVGIWVSYKMSFKPEDEPTEDSIPSPDEFIPVDVQPEQTYEEIPEYPAKAIDQKISGFVIVEVFVDEKGIPKKVQVKTCQPRNWGFEDVAVKAAYKCRYKPALRDGKPIGIWVSYKVDFFTDKPQ
jgi:TonB family protein